MRIDDRVAGPLYRWIDDVPMSFPVMVILAGGLTGCFGIVGVGVWFNWDSAFASIRILGGGAVTLGCGAVTLGCDGVCLRMVLVQLSNSVSMVRSKAELLSCGCLLLLYRFNALYRSLRAV